MSAASPTSGTPSWPARSIEECHAIMTSPGAPWELETVTIKGRPQKVYKNLPGSIRDLFVRTK